MKTDYKLQSNDQLTLLIKTKGFSTWNFLTEFIKNLPYGRNTNRTDFSLVISERKGTCSSKHAFLKQVAILNDIPNIKLMLGLYKMNNKNTPKIGNVLIENNIEFIPEAHCYLLVEGQRIDYTSLNSDFTKIKDAIILEQDIEPFQIVEYKVNFHKAFIKNWVLAEGISFSFDEVWKIREACIGNLSR